MTRTVLALLLAGAPLARAQDAPPETPLPNQGIPNDDPVMTLGAAVGAGMVQERETGRNPTFALRVDGAVGLPAHGRIVASCADGFHDQTYLSTAPAADGGGSQEVTLYEQTLKAGLGADWDLAPYMPFAPDGAHARLGMAPWLVFLHDASFSSWLVALRLSGSVEVPLAKRLSAVGHGAFAPGLGHSKETLSALGLPRHAWDAGVGLSEQFGDFAVTGGWTVDGLLFERTHRVRHLAMVGLTFSK